ncbi:MAG TPA: PqqD family protein [Acidimicrobiia bacterium]|jgi:hypothetical protein
MIDAEFVPVRAGAVYTVAIDGEAVLLDETHDRLHHLNPTAALLWSCFDGDATVEQLATEASEELHSPFATVFADTVAVVRDLVAQDLVRDGREAPA